MHNIISLKLIENKSKSILRFTFTSYLLKVAFDVANRERDGHLSIFKFTTNYKVGLGTPYDGSTREYISKLYTGKTLREALLRFLYENL